MGWELPWKVVMEEKFALSTTMPLNSFSGGAVAQLSYPNTTIPIVDYHMTVIGTATLVSLCADEAVYESSIPIEGRQISGSWRRDDNNKLSLVEVCFFGPLVSHEL